MAFLALHGLGGEDGSVQGLLEIMNIPYTGSGICASAVCMDKGLTRMVLQATGIPVPAGETLRAPGVPSRPPGKLDWPVVVKPCTEGSSIGVSLVKQSTEWKRAVMKAFRYGQQAVVEKYISGREVAVSVLGTTIFPAVEVIAPGGFYDFRAKYGKAATRYFCPAPLSSRLERLLRELSVQAYQALGCRGAARVDFRIHPNGRPYVLELNTIPGMTKRSLLPMAAAQHGMTYDDLVEAMLHAALPKDSRFRWSNNDDEKGNEMMGSGRRLFRKTASEQSAAQTWGFGWEERKKAQTITCSACCCRKSSGLPDCRDPDWWAICGRVGE